MLQKLLPGIIVSLVGLILIIGITIITVLIWSLSGRTIEPTLAKIELSDYPQAVCSDGSRANFYFRKGDSQNTNKWIIYIGGTNRCTDKESCSKLFKEDPDKMRAYTTATFESEGILSSSKEINPDFYNYNHVYIPYCSADMWAGDQENIFVSLYKFKGQDIFQSTIDYLIKNENLNASTDITLVGSDYGGFGVTHNIDWLNEYVTEPIEVKGIIENFWLSTSVEDNVINDNFIEFTNTQQDSSCIEQYSIENRLNPSTCFYSNRVQEYIDSPILYMFNSTEFSSVPNDLESTNVLTFSSEDNRSLVSSNEVFSNNEELQSKIKEFVED